MTASSRRFLALWFKHLATDRIERSVERAPERLKPRVTAEPVKGAQRLADGNAQALKLGLRPGMALADARAMYPGLAVHPAGRAADLNLLTLLAKGALRYTPLAALDAPDGLMLDITGCAHLFGGEAQMGQDIVRRLHGQGFSVRFAAAPTPLSAAALARHAPGQCIEPSGLKAAVLPLPLFALRLDQDIKDGLAQAGFQTIGDLATRPRAPLSARFGAPLLAQLDEILGLASRPITPLQPLPRYAAERHFCEPIVTEAAVLGLIEPLMGELQNLMAPRQEGALSLRLMLFRADGHVEALETGFSAPCLEGGRAKRLFREKLASLHSPLDAGFGYDLVRLSVTEAGRIDAQQNDLDQAQAGLAKGTGVSDAIERLAARFGSQALSHIALRARHIPECAVEPIEASVRLRVRKHASPAQAALLSDPAFEAPPWSRQESAALTRPLRLLLRPEPVAVIAAIPDGPPRQFIWRRARHSVVRAEGPERVASEWWGVADTGALTRDYFRIEDAQGRRFWLFRDGLYGRETSEPRWFLHGVFA